MLLDRQPLGQLLVKRGVLQSAQLDRALAEQRRCNHEKLLGEILVEQQLCSDAQITEALALAYGIPFARVTPRLADPKVVALLPMEFLHRSSVLPMFKVADTLTVAITEPANLFLVEEIERRTSLKAQIVAATSRDIRSTLEAYLPAEQAFVVDANVAELGPKAFRILGASGTAVESPVDPPVARLIEYCIYTAIEQKASEIHVEPGDAALRVRFRIDGRLVQRLTPPLRMHGPLSARLKVLAGLDPRQARRPQEGQIRVAINDHPITLRLLTAPARPGEKLVLRVLEEDRGILKLEKLGFGYDMLKQWRKLLAMPGGLLLVCGPAGSGKRAVLYSSLNERNVVDSNVSSVEEPVEQALAGVNQFPVDEAGGFGFSAALGAVLRQEPDVVMISDLRDADTARLATNAALAGKLVIAGMNAFDAPAAISRLTNLGLEPHLLGATLTGVLSRRLVRKLCPACKAAYEPSSAQKRQIEPRAIGLTTLYRARGCERCHHLGFAGRIGIHELLVTDDALRERLGAGVALPELRAHCQRQQLKSLRADGLEKAQAGITTPEEVFRVTM